jgi:hypothetical protein
VIGDVEGHNKICTQYGSHQTYCLPLECDCTTESSDDPDVVCNYIKASYLTKLRLRKDTKTLQSLAFHNVTNAFDNVCFGANEYEPPPAKSFTPSRRVCTYMPWRVSTHKWVDNQFLTFLSLWCNACLRTVFTKVTATCPVSSLQMESQVCKWNPKLRQPPGT